MVKWLGHGCDMVTRLHGLAQDKLENITCGSEIQYLTLPCVCCIAWKKLHAWIGRAERLDAAVEPVHATYAFVEDRDAFYSLRRCLRGSDLSLFTLITP